MTDIKSNQCHIYDYFILTSSLKKIVCLLVQITYQYWSCAAKKSLRTALVCESALINQMMAPIPLILRGSRRIIN